MRIEPFRIIAGDPWRGAVQASPFEVGALLGGTTFTRFVAASAAGETAGAPPDTLSTALYGSGTALGFLSSGTTRR